MSKIKITQYDYIGRFQRDPDHFEPTFEDIKCELQLQALETWETLTFRWDETQFRKDISAWEDKWQTYLHRPDRVNNRYGLLISGMPGDKATDGASLPEAFARHNTRDITDKDFCEFTDIYHDLKSLQPLLDYFAPLGRTYLLKMDPGSYFPPHKDNPHITRDTFRIAAFIGDLDHSQFMWYMDDKRIPLQSGEVAYVNTQKQHGTSQWNGATSYHLIMSIPKTWENVIKLMSICARN